MKEYRNRWYVIGKDADKGKIKTFGLDRISDLNTAGELFEVDKKFDPEILFKHSFGITAGGKPEKIVLKFAPLEGRFIKSQPLHPSQNIIEDDETGLTINIKVIPSYELKSAILSYGNRVEVLKGDVN
jgi:predicted DNA-binding transcriptional regulator YafY